ncbi:MAG: TonB-dependent receptor [Opitutae bacterium]|nr:TonB-dependent receptor [Opitutae bacterium]
MNLRSVLVRIAALPLLAGSALVAQTAPTRAPETSPANDEVVTLQEFAVTASSASEYTSSESTTGTRIASSIRDLPFKVSVVTGEFMDDFNALEFREQMGYTSNVVGYETISTGYQIRGFDGDVQLRNGFRRIGLIDKVNIERAEVIKGPAASIYGAVFPGGTINFVTRKPRVKNEDRFTVTAGTNDSHRVQASTTGPLGGSGKLFYRIDGALDERRYDQPFKFRYQGTISGQLLWRPSINTSLLVEAEFLERREQAISSANVPLLVQTTADPYRVPSQNRTYNRYVRLATELIDFNPQGPHNFSNRYVKNLTATLEHRFSPIFTFRSSANWFDRGLVRQEVGGRDQYNATTGRTQRGTARYRPFPEGGLSWQNDLLASFETGAIKHKLLFTLDYQRQTQAPEQYDAATNAAFPAAVASGLSVADPDYGFVSYIDNPSLYSTIQKDDSRIDIYGAFLSERATMLDGKLIVLAGLRYDSSKSVNDDLTTAPVTRTEFSAHAYTHQLGANYRVLPAITLYANKSTSFVPQFGVGKDANGASFPLPNEDGRGWEAGVKAGLLDNRLTFTLGYFDITLENVATTDSTTNITYVTGEQRSKGVELDFNWVVTPSLQFFGGYGYTDATIVRNDVARHLIGSTPRRAPRDTLGVGAKYELKQGKLKGFYATAGVRYTASALVNPSTGRNLTASASNPIVNSRLPNGILLFPNLAEGALVTSGSVRVDDGRESVANAPSAVVDAGVGYKFKVGRYRQKIQLNAGNILDRRYTFGSGGQGDRRSFAVTYDVTF